MAKELIIAVTGAQGRATKEDYELLKKTILELKPTVILTGGIGIADHPEAMAKKIAEELDIKYKEILPLYLEEKQFSLFRKKYTRQEELDARARRRMKIAKMADGLILMPSSNNRDSGWLITGAWFVLSKRYTFRYFRII